MSFRGKRSSKCGPKHPGHAPGPKPYSFFTVIQQYLVVFFKLGGIRLSMRPFWMNRILIYLITNLKKLRRFIEILINYGFWW